MKNIAWYLCSIALLISNWIGAQTPQQDLEKIKNAYEQLVDIQLEVNYLVYKDHHSQEVFEREKGGFKRSGNNYLLDVLEMVLIQNEKYHLMLSKEDKTIYLLATRPQQPDILQLSLDDALAICSDIKPLPKKGVDQGYQFLFTDNYAAEMERIDLYFNPDSYLVTELVFYYRRGYNISDDLRQPDYVHPRMHIQYQLISTKQKLPKSTFDLSPYIRFSDGALRLTVAYRDYRLVDQTQKN